MMGTVIVIAPIVALAAGIAILVWPKLLNYIVAGYLILIGLIGLFPHVMGQAMMTPGG